jgi:hypothetical protein
MTTKVQVNSNYPHRLFVDTLNLISTMIGPVWQPVIPLIDAAAFNEKTNKISDQIMDEEQKVIEKYKSILITSLNEKIQSEIITGADLTSVAADRYKVENGLQIENRNFPVVFFCEGDMNVLDFGNGKNIDNIFKNDEDLKARIVKFATDLDLKFVLVSYNRLSVVGVGAFGVRGALRLESYLYLYYSDGRLVMDAYGYTKPTNVSGNRIDQYKFQLDNFHGLAQLMSQELVNYLQ